MADSVASATAEALLPAALDSNAEFVQPPPQRSGSSNTLLRTLSRSVVNSERTRRELLASARGNQPAGRTIARTALLLGEAHVGKHTLLSTLDALQRAACATRSSAALDSDDVARIETDWNDAQQQQQRLDMASRTISVSLNNATGTSILDKQLMIDTYPNAARVLHTSEICKISLSVQRVNTERVSIAQLTRTDDTSALQHELTSRWGSVMFFVVVFSLTDFASYLAAQHWIDIMVLWLASDATTRARNCDGRCTAYLVGTHADEAQREPARRCVAASVARTLADTRRMRYVEVNATKPSDLEHLFGSMLYDTLLATIEAAQDNPLTRASRRPTQHHQRRASLSARYTASLSDEPKAAIDDGDDDDDTSDSDLQELTGRANWTGWLCAILCLHRSPRQGSSTAAAAANEKTAHTDAIEALELDFVSDGSSTRSS